jgi:hypothetical protein
MAVAFSSPSLGHLKMQGKRLEKLRENTGQILPERKNDPTPPSVGDQSPTRGRAITDHCPAVALPQRGKDCGLYVYGLKRKTSKSDGAYPIEHVRHACGGTGFPAVVQPVRPDRKIYPAPCKSCGGKGWISEKSDE